MGSTLSPHDTKIVETKGSMDDYKYKVESWYYTNRRDRDVYVEVKLTDGSWILVHLRLPR